jgi:ribonuclease P protein component
VLPVAHRLTRPDGFRHAVRNGRRAGSRTVVVHAALPAAGGGSPAEVGLVVSKAVGNAVVRNRVKRRLRHLARDHVAALPDDALVVIRAQGAAAAASYQELGSDLDRCLTRVLR